MKIIVLIFIALSLHADVKEDMLNLYQNKKYHDACDIGYNNYSKNKQDEDFLSLYAFSCLHSDNINRLSAPIATLKFTKESRANAAFFSVIVMQKKLLYHALSDGYDFTSIKLPTTDYILSKVFDSFAELGKHKAREFYIFQDKDDKKLTYKLYLTKNERFNKIIIEEYYDTIAIKRHVYW